MEELFIRSMAYSIATTYDGQTANDACGRDTYDQIKVKATVPKFRPIYNDCLELPQPLPPGKMFDPRRTKGPCDEPS